MGDKDDKDTRGLDDIIGDIEQHIDDAEKSSKPSPKKPAPPPEKPAPPPEKPAPQPESAASEPLADEVKQVRKEVDEETLERLARVRETLDRQDPIIRRTRKRTRMVLLVGALVVIVLIGFFYFHSINKIDVPLGTTDVSPLDPSAPADSRTGPMFEEEQKRLQAAMPKVSAGNPEGLRELHSLATDSPKSPQAVKALSVLATTYRYQKQNSVEAIKAYRKLLEDYPDHRDTHRTRKYFIEYLIELGRMQEAKDQAEILVEEAKGPEARAMAEAILKQIP